MAEASALLFAYCETPVHAGTGRSVGTVDLPIQRERITGFPIVQASSVKGVLRATTQANGADAERHRALFGPDRPEEASTHAGALQVTDLQVVLFPVRSLAGVFAWTTSPAVLARLGRLAKLAGLEGPVDSTRFAGLQPGQCAVANGSALLTPAGQQVGVVLEEYSFTLAGELAGLVSALAEWLVALALPQTPEYAWWRENLAKHLCVLPDDEFRDFVLYATEIEAHVRLKDETKTVESGALWTTETLPAETLLVGLLATTRSRYDKVNEDGRALLGWLTGKLDGRRVRLGGDETTGRGAVVLRVARV
jgi:CRISPR-associated protein Cmr4